MALKAATFVSLCAVALAARLSNPPSGMQSVTYYKNAKDTGTFKNCGDAKHNFTLTFSPTTIKVGQDMLLYMSLTPATQLSSGTMSVTLTVPGVPDPIYKQQMEFSCKDIDPYVKNVCPFIVGKPIEGSYNYTVPTRAHTVDIPTGQYHVRMEIRNQFTDPFLCGESDMTIINPQL